MKDRKIAVITGASRGIGKAVAYGLAEKGYKTILIARNKDKMQEISDQINDKFGIMSDIHALDLSDFDKVTKLFENIIADYKRIDVLVNNAAAFIKGSFEADIESYKKALDVNLVSPYTILKTVLPFFKEQKSGYIFNVASRAGKIGFPTSASYVSTKFGLVGLSESVYREMADYGVKVTSLCPSYVNTDMAQETGTNTPTDEMIQPDDIMKTIDWLLGMSKAVSVKEVVIECRSGIL